MDNKTVVESILEASRLNNLSTEKLVKKQVWTNRLMFMLIAVIPLTVWFDNRGFLTLFYQRQNDLFLYVIIAIMFFGCLGYIFHIMLVNKNGTQ